MEKTLKQCALDYAAMGFAVFPITPRNKIPLKGSSGCKEATRNIEQIETWWDQNPNYNIGIATGKASGGLVVVDLDIDSEKNKDGVKRFQEWMEAKSMEIPKTVSVRTGKGGLHFYFRDTSRKYKNATNLFKDGTGVDIRADGGYVVAPGSIHPNGNRYEWENMPLLTGIQPLPVAIGDLLVNPPKGKTKAAENEGKGSFSMPPGNIPEGERTDKLLKALASMQSKGFSDEAIRAAIYAENDRCTPPMTDKELESTVFSALKRFEKGTASYELDREYNSRLVDRLREMRPEQNKRYGRNDAGNSYLFSDLCRGRFCYVPKRKKWYFYDGKHWVEDSQNQAMEYCKAIADALMQYCAQYVEDETVKNSYVKHIEKWLRFHNREVILKDASSVAPVYISEFDSDSFLLNCENGTLDLNSGNFREHDSADKITKLAAVKYDPGARCERWESFIEEVTCGDSALAAYIQKALGYALTGDTSYECFFILYGATSRNGKSTLCETFMRLMGDYGRSANAETVAKRKYNDSRSPTEDVARLAGARFVQMGEPDKSMVFNASLLKTLTGNDTVTTRFLGENSFEYRPQFKIFLNTNHLPYVSDVTLFSSDRVKVIPFNRHFTEEEQDHELKKVLVKPESLSGILNWCMEGLQALRTEGWMMPEAVREATQEYRDTSDKVGQFISDKLQCDPTGECDARTVYGLYQTWCLDNGFKAEGSGEFRKSLKTAGMTIKQKRPNGAGRNANKCPMIIGYIIAE
ncbi:MAG: phage/plasmid primase, P4 family [Lachnospiraceae bacterium]|nr:phage/plasmid primase, P4 family [Lachnospiraceae bacterium]